MSRSNKYDSNKIIIHDSYAEIIIITSKNETFNVLIDPEDVEKCRPYKWHIQKVNENYFRVCAYNKGDTPKILKLHRLIMDVHIKDNSIEVDHIDGNTLDNRKSNLRLCKHSDNMKNIKTPENNTSGFKGVELRKDTNKWTAFIECNGNKVNLGCFDDKEHAIKARQDKELELFGEFSRLHIIQENKCMKEKLEKENLESQVYTIADIAKLLCIGETTARKLASLRGFPTMRIGRQYRVRKTDFDRWLSQNHDVEIIL